MYRKRKSALDFYSGLVNRLFVRLLVLLFVHEARHALPPSLGTPSGLLVGAFCPHRLCNCDDEQLKVTCSNANLDVVPITLNPNLKNLNLSDNHIRRVSRSSFTVYRNLQYLDLSGNQLGAVEDNSFAGQNKLKVLKMERNTISTLTNQTWSGLQGLETLHLNHNALPNITDAVFASVKRLETLDLTSNRINFLGPKAFLGLSRLKRLFLRDNQLGLDVEEPIGAANFAGKEGFGGLPNASAENLILSLPALSPQLLPNLVRLDLGQNAFGKIMKAWSPFMSPSESLRGPDDSSIGTDDRLINRDNSEGRRKGPPSPENRPDANLWAKLEELFLDGCRIKGIERGSFNSLTSLLILRIHDNYLEEIPGEALQDLPNLQVLQIGQNSFRKINPNAFSGLKKLRSLDISRCAFLEVIEREAFAGVPKLQRLEISFNPRLKYLSPELVTGLFNLRYLSLRGNSLSTLDGKLAPLGHQLEVLDVRDNPFACNCSVQWIRKLFLALRNHSSSQRGTGYEGSKRGLILPLPPQLDPEKGQVNRDSHLPLALRQHVNLTPSPPESHPFPLAGVPPPAPTRPKAHVFEISEVKCAKPAPLRGKRLIDLDPEDIGCFEVESLAPIVIAVIIGCLILLGVIIIFGIRFRSKLAGFVKGTSSKNSVMNCYPPPPPSAKLPPNAVNNNRKVFGLHGSHGGHRPVNDLDSLCSKPDFIYVHNSVNIESNLINNLNNPYEVVPITGRRSSSLSSYDEGVECPLKATPTTEL